jgi:hypothetical protein
MLNRTGFSRVERDAGLSFDRKQHSFISMGVAKVGANPLNPYNRLGSEAFWKRAIAEKSPLELQGIYRKKFDLGEKRIATAGSCFAQHIGRVLRQNGFKYLDYEPAPRRLKPVDRAQFGYGIYSARYGNVYTARQLLQLFQRAYGEFKPRESAWINGDRVFDPFRPNIEPDGFGSIAELEAHREAHLAAVRQVFRWANVFVFTMGLTETWLSREDGAAYPVVPGAGGVGTYNPDAYTFKNMTASEVLLDMKSIISSVRKINPSCKFLLTVSPVPLVATASGNHVLPATVYSKSVLRAVAGELSSEDVGIDYFPSYEIISSHPMRAIFFQPNMRDVTEYGVNFVMSHFLSEHKPSAQAAAPIIEKQESFDWTMCDEEKLEGFAG